MSSTDLFSFLGIKIIENFLPIDLCDQLVEDMIKSKKIKAAIEYKGTKDLNEGVRKNKISFVSKESRDLVDGALKGIIPEIESFFKFENESIETSQFLYYERGHFFHQHRDVEPDSQEGNKRKISVVIFLNDAESVAEGKGYTGGELRLFGLNDRFPDNAFAIPVKKGLMVAFKSSLLHEVTPIESGTRCTYVVWLN